MTKEVYFFNLHRFFIPGKLARLLSLRRLTAEEFAQMIGAAPTAVSNWLTVRSKPSRESFKKIHEGLNVSPSAIITLPSGFT